MFVFHVHLTDHEQDCQPLPADAQSAIHYGHKLYSNPLYNVSTMDYLAHRVTLIGSTCHSSYLEDYCLSAGRLSAVDDIGM